MYSWKLSQPITRYFTCIYFVPALQLIVISLWTDTTMYTFGQPQIPDFGDSVPIVGDYLQCYIPLQRTSRCWVRWISWLRWSLLCLDCLEWMRLINIQNCPTSTALAPCIVQGTCAHVSGRVEGWKPLMKATCQAGAISQVLLQISILKRSMTIYYNLWYIYMSFPVIGIWFLFKTDMIKIM